MRFKRYSPEIFAFLSIIILTVFCNPITSYTQDVDYLFSEGTRLKDAGLIDDAIDVLKYAVDKQYNFPEAHHLLARCYLEKEHYLARKQAMFAIDHALDMDWKNIEYQHTLSDIYLQKGMHVESNDVCKRILKMDPDNVLALEKLGEYYYDRFMVDMIRVQSSDDELMIDHNIAGYIFGEELKDLHFRQILHTLEKRSIEDGKVYFKLRLSDLAAKDMEKATEHYDRILEIEPDHHETVLKKGTMIFEMQEYDKFIDFFADFLQYSDIKKDVHLFLGLGYSRKSDYKTANDHYQKALALMDDHERAVFENIEYINPDFDIETWRKTQVRQNADTSGFWNRKDPLLSTPWNERRIEHYGRVAEANLKHNQPRLHLAGWETDLGRIFIRYGKPNRIEMNRGSTPDYTAFDLRTVWHEDTEVIKLMLMANNDRFRKNLFWYYDDFTFVFNTKSRLWMDDFQLGKWGGIDFREIEKTEFAEHTDYYKYKPKGTMFRFPVDFVTFRGNQDETDVLVSYSVPLKVVDLERERENWTGELHHGVYVHDEDWAWVSGRTDTTVLELNSTFHDTSLVSFYSIGKELQLQSGLYNFAVEQVDPSSGNTGSYRKEMTVEDYTGDSLRMSDIFLAYSVRHINNRLPVSRDNITYTANPSHAFNSQQDIHLYFEVYNLIPVNDFSQYRIDYVIHPEKAERSLWESLIWRGRRNEGLSISSNISVESDTDNVVHVIENTISKPGMYFLVLRVTDLNSGQSVRKSTKIAIYESDTGKN